MDSANTSEVHMDKLKIINLTPNTLRICDSAGDLVETVEPSGVVAHASVTRIKAGKVGAIELYETIYSLPSVIGQPAPGEVYVVSSIYLQSVRAYGADDTGLYTPGDLARDKLGNTIGLFSCVGLSR